ncbi:hypothetical protein PG984_008498 [Apiospora sp. TS-2023a]
MTPSSTARVVGAATEHHHSYRHGSCRCDDQYDRNYHHATPTGSTTATTLTTASIPVAVAGDLTRKAARGSPGCCVGSK